MPELLHTAHGTARDGGALLVAEATPLDEVPPLNAERTSAALALRRVRGRPFQLGNTAASDRGPSLTRVRLDPGASDEQRRVHRKASSLKQRRERELSVQCGAPVSTAVRVELVAWSRDTAWAEHFDRQGDAMKAAALAEKASGHGLKAIGIAEREASTRGQDFAAFARDAERATQEAIAEERARAALVPAADIADAETGETTCQAN